MLKNERISKYEKSNLINHSNVCIFKLCSSRNFLNSQTTKKAYSLLSLKNVKKGDDDFGATEIVGHFKKFNGSFDYDAANKTVKDLKVEIDVASIDTDMPKETSTFALPISLM